MLPVFVMADPGAHHFYALKGRHPARQARPQLLIELGAVHREVMAVGIHLRGRFHPADELGSVHPDVEALRIDDQRQIGNRCRAGEDEN